MSSTPHWAGEPTDSLSRATLGGTMLGLLSRFANNFQSAVEGKGFNSADGVDTFELYGGARYRLQDPCSSRHPKPTLLGQA